MNASATTNAKSTAKTFAGLIARAVVAPIIHSFRIACGASEEACPIGMILTNKGISRSAGRVEAACLAFATLQWLRTENYRGQLGYNGLTRPVLWCVKGVHMAEDNEIQGISPDVVGGGLPDEEVLYDLADLFKVFADTTRIRILYALMDGELFVNEIAEAVGISQSGVSHQLRTLKQAKLIRSTRDGKNVRYSLDDDHVMTMLAQGLTHVTE
jgi:DNA-binding transcriptional ArsR family regulator